METIQDLHKILHSIYMLTQLNSCCYKNLLYNSLLHRTTPPKFHLADSLLKMRHRSIFSFVLDLIINAVHIVLLIDFIFTIVTVPIGP